MNLREDWNREIGDALNFGADAAPVEPRRAARLSRFGGSLIPAARARVANASGYDHFSP